MIYIVAEYMNTYVSLFGPNSFPFLYIQTQAQDASADHL